MPSVRMLTYDPATRTVTIESSCGQVVRITAAPDATNQQLADAIAAVLDSCLITAADIAIEHDDQTGELAGLSIASPQIVPVEEDN